MLGFGGKGMCGHACRLTNGYIPLNQSSMRMFARAVRMGFNTLSSDLDVVVLGVYKQITSDHCMEEA